MRVVSVGENDPSHQHKENKQQASRQATNDNDTAPADMTGTWAITNVVGIGREQVRAQRNDTRFCPSIERATGIGEAKREMKDTIVPPTPPQKKNRKKNK